MSAEVTRLGLWGRMSARPMAPLAAAALLAVAVLVGCSALVETQSPISSDEPSGTPSTGDTSTPSGGDGRPYDGELLGFTIADVEALAADRGLECAPHQPMGRQVGYFCTTSTPELATPEWFMVTGYTWGDEVYNLSILVSTAPPSEQASRDAAADFAEALMPWITDLDWYRSGDFRCGPGRRPVPEFDNFGPVYSICGSSSADPGGDGMRAGAELDIATEPDVSR